MVLIFKNSLFLLIFITLCYRAMEQNKRILVETENFDPKGGWVVDHHFMDEMGSLYLLAHGLGIRDGNKVTTVSQIKNGKYCVMVRTKDWIVTWNADEAPGKFNVVINGIILPGIFRTKNAEWIWQDDGIIDIKGTKVRSELQDLTGFEGRCDSILLCEKLNFQSTL